MSDADRPTDARPPAAQGGSIENTLAGGASLEIAATLREAWARTDGIKGMLAAGMLLLCAALLLVTAALDAVFGAEPTLAASTVGQLVTMMLVYPFMAGVLLLGLRHSVGLPVHFQDQFACYARLLPLLAVGLVQNALTGIGWLLLILPGIYLSIALSLALPLKAERDLPITDCLLVSLRLVNRKLFEVTVLSLLAGLLVALGVISLIGWIWTLPWAVMILAIVYRQLAGFRPPAALTGVTF